MSVNTGSYSSKNKVIFHICAFIAVTLWGASFVSSGVLKNVYHLTAVEIYIYRFLLAYILIWPFCHGKLWANSLTDEMLLLLCGLSGGSLYFIAENNAVGHTMPSNVSLLTTLAPLLTTLFIGILYKNDRPGKWVYAGSLIALAGVMCIIFKSGFNMKVAPLGDLLALSASFSWSIYSLVLRKVDVNYSALFITRKTFFYGLITAIPFWLLEKDHSGLAVFAVPAVWGNILFLGLGASLFSYFVWSMAVQRLGAIQASNYLYFQPISTMAFSAVLYDNDPITLVGCIGCVLIIGGVWLGDRMAKRGRMRQN